MPARQPRPDPDALFAPSRARRLPFDFVLAELVDLDPVTRPLFGCTAVYVGEKIVLALRDKPGDPTDRGVWLATTREHHASLRAELPSLRSITVLGDGVTGWQILPADADDFEDAALRACAMIRAGDPRVGKIPKPKRPRASPPAAKRSPRATKR